MKLIIEQNGVKRALEGSFMLCISRDDARHLLRQLQQCVDDDFYYGWVDIAGRMSQTHDTKPMPWGEEQ